MANELKITKCVATPTNVIVYFSSSVDVTSASAPEQTANYSVYQLIPSEPGPGVYTLGPAITVTGARYDVIGRATVLYLAPPPQPPGQQLQVTVNNLTSGGSPLAGSKAFRVQMDGAEVQRDREQLQKILQPSYAMGMGVISRDDYQNLKNEYFAQCELSLGLIIPLILIVLGLSLTPQVGLQQVGLPQLGLPHLAWGWPLVCLAMVPLSTLLFLVGTERYHKYRMELKLLILGNWQKQQEAAKKAASNGDSSKKTPAAPASSATTIDVKPIVVQLQTSSAAEKPPQPSPGPSAPEKGKS